MYENTNLKIYQNGVLVLNQNLEYSPTEGPSNNVYIGSRGDYWQNDDYNFNGKIEYLSCYNRVFTLEEIQCEANVENNNVIGYWSFNEGSGGTVYDLSGNGNHGIIHGATYSEDIPEQNCIELDLFATNFNSLVTLDDGSCISQEEFTIDSLQQALAVYETVEIEQDYFWLLMV